MNQVLKPISSPLFRLLLPNLKKSKTLSTFSKEVTKQNSPAVQNTDLLMNNLKNTRSINGILELVNTHYKIMNPLHTVQALRTIFTLQKYGNSGISTSQLLNHPDFERICNHIKYHAGSIELNDTIEALKVMSFVGVSSDSTIYQILLQLLKQNINQLSLHQIVFLDFLLSKAKSCPLVEALQIALPIVYDIQLPLKLDQTNMNLLSEHLHYISKKNVSNQSVELVVNSLMKSKFFDSKTSVSIIWSICDMEPDQYFEPLLNKALKSLEITGYDVSYQDLETTLGKLLTQFSSKTPFYYNEMLFDYCARILLKEDLGFETGIHLLKKFVRISHNSEDLLNYITEKCYQNPDLILFGDPVHIYYIICGCAMTEFRPKYYEIIKEYFSKIKDFTGFHKKEIHLLKFQTALCALDIYIPEIMEKCLNQNYLDKTLRRRYWSDYENVLLISQVIKTLKPEFSNYLPSDNFLSQVKSTVKTSSDYPLKGLLHRVFGGEQFVKTEVSTKMLHHIDHLILLKKGGLASALNLSDIYVEDIKCESPSQIILIMVLHNWQYTINCQRLKGATCLMLKTLEAKGYSVVPIYLDVWKSLPEFEKVPYIVEGIKTKTENFERACL